MNNIYKLSLALLTAALVGCGGGGDESNENQPPQNTTPIKPTINNISDDIVMDIAGANGLIMTGDLITNKSSISLKNNNFNSATPNISQRLETTLTENTTYKINPDGSLEEVDVTAGGEDARGALKLVEINTIGDDFVLVVFEKAEVQFLIRDFIVGGSNPEYEVGRDSNVLSSYLIDIKSGQARKADFLGTPIFDYDENNDGVYQFRNDVLNDFWVSLDTSEGIREQIRDNTYFDQNGDMYTISFLPDYELYRESGGEKRQYRKALIKVKTSEINSSGSLSYEEINVAFTGDFITSQFTASNDGSFVFFYKDSQFSAYSVNGETVEKLGVDRLIHGGNDRLYGFANNSSEFGEVYTITTSENTISKTLLREYDGSESYQIPSGNNGYTINGLLVIANDGSYQVFNEKTGQVIGEYDIAVDADADISSFHQVATKNAMFILYPDKNVSKLIGWIPNTFTRLPLTFNLGALDSAFFEISSFDITGNSEITFEATLLAELDGYNIGDRIIATYNFLLGSDVQIIDTLNVGQPSISGVLGFSQGDFINVDGFARDWNVDFRFITDASGDTDSANGDISYVSMYEDESDYWFLVEGASELSSVMTSINLDENTSVRHNQFAGIYLADDIETPLYNINGISATFNNVVEFTVPKSSLMLSELDISVTTHNRVSDIDASLFDAQINQDTGEVMLDIFFAKSLDATLTYEIFGETLIIEEDGDNYKVDLNGSTLSSDNVLFAEKHLTIALPSGTFSFVDIPQLVDIEMISIPKHVDTLIDTTL